MKILYFCLLLQLLVVNFAFSFFYKQMIFYGADFSNFVKQEKVGVQNVVHCASLCGANEEDCKGFLYDVTTMICKFIDFQNLIPKFSLNSFSGFVNYGKYFIALVLPVEHRTCNMVGVPPPPP